MSEKYKPGDNQLPHFITFSVVKWIDALTRSIYKDIIVESLKYCVANKGMKLNAWVIMSNHIHLIMHAAENFLISNIMRDFKKFTSNQILNSIQNNPKEGRSDWLMFLFERQGKFNPDNEVFQFWQQGYHPIELFNPKILKQKIDYVHENPVRSGIVREPQDYVYSSAIDYYTDRKGMIELDLI